MLLLNHEFGYFSIMVSFLTFIVYCSTWKQGHLLSCVLTCLQLCCSVCCMSWPLKHWAFNFATLFSIQTFLFFHSLSHPLCLSFYRCQQWLPLPHIQINTSPTADVFNMMPPVAPLCFFSVALSVLHLAEGVASSPSLSFCRLITSLILLDSHYIPSTSILDPNDQNKTKTKSMLVG